MCYLNVDTNLYSSYTSRCFVCTHDGWECGQVFVEHAAADGTFMYSDAVRAFCGMGARGCVTLHMKPVQAVPPETAFLALSDTWPKLLEEVRLLVLLYETVVVWGSLDVCTMRWISMDA